MTRQMIDFQKQVIDGWHDTAAFMENQTSLAVNWMIDTAAWMPDEGRQAMEQWMSVCKKERSRFKAHVDQGLTMVEKIFVESKAPAPTPAKPKSKPATKKKETPNEPV